jgi:hypothetical protein
MVYAMPLTRTEAGSGMRIAWRGMGVWGWVGVAAMLNDRFRGVSGTTELAFG